MRLSWHNLPPRSSRQRQLEEEMKERSLFLMRAGRRWRSWQKFRERDCPPPDENKFMPEISQKRIFWRGNWISKSNMGGEKEKTWDVLAYLLPQSPSWHQFTTNYWQDKGGCTAQTRKDSESKEWKSWRCQPGQENVNYLEPNLELPTDLTVSLIWSQVRCIH